MFLDLQKESFKRLIMKTLIETISTPDNRFSTLKDYPFQPHYIKIDGMNMHYVDEGKHNENTIFLFHGQPSWSYLYRHMIPQLVTAGYRVIAPDLIGFGKSDKPIHTKDHTYSNHVRWVSQFVQKMGIKNATAFMQDWGGMIGLRVLADNPYWLDQLIVANTALAEVKGIAKFIFPKVMKIIAGTSGKPSVEKFKAKMNFGNWAGYFSRSETLEIGKIMQVLTTKNLTPEEMYAYDAPFPNEQFYAGPRTMPQIIASDLNEVNEAWEKLRKWNKPVLTLFSDKDPFLADRGYDKKFQENFKGAKDQPHLTITNASHFLQEDQADMLVKNVTNWINN